MAVRDALIVAVARYTDAKLRRLRAPAADAERLRTVLEDRAIGDFRVAVASDESEGALRRRLARFFSNRAPDDLLVLHFSCHGVKDDKGELYLAAADTESDPDLLAATAIAASWLNEQIGRCRSKRIVVLLDCCFSGSFRLGLQARAGDAVDVPGHLGGRGRAVITASNSMEYAFEGDRLSGAGEPSIFTGAVVDGLATGTADRDGDGWISIDELYDYVYDEVRAQTPSQTPTKISSLEGPLYIARSQRRRAAPTIRSRPAAPARALPAADWSARPHVVLEIEDPDAARLLFGGVNCVVFSPDGTQLATGSSNKNVRVRAADSGREVTCVTHDEGVTDLAFSPDEWRLATAGTDWTVRLWDIDSSREWARITHDNSVTAVAFSPDGRQMATASDDKTARVWEVANHRELTRVIHSKGVTGVAFSPDGRQIVTASDDKTARVWDVDNGRELARVTHVARVTGVAFSPDGEHIATACADWSARVWDIESRREVAHVTHVKGVAGIVFSPDGRQIATASADKTARVWEVDSGRELARITHTRRVRRVAFSPDGRQIATASGDSYIRVWQARELPRAPKRDPDEL